MAATIVRTVNTSALQARAAELKQRERQPSPKVQDRATRKATGLRGASRKRLAEERQTREFLAKVREQGEEIERLSAEVSALTERLNMLKACREDCRGVRSRSDEFVGLTKEIQATGKELSVLLPKLRELRPKKEKFGGFGHMAEALSNVML